MNKFQLVILFSLATLVRGDVTVLQSNALLITVVLSVLACGVPMVCFCVIVCLIAKLIQMHAKLRAHGRPTFEEFNYNISLTEGTTKDYKRISNVYEVVETESIVSLHQKSDSCDSNAPSNIPCKEGNYQTDRVPDIDLQEALKLSLLTDVGNENDEDDSVYVVMTSPMNYDEGQEEIIQAFN